jgi:hypothetical protein
VSGYVCVFWLSVFGLSVMVVVVVMVVVMVVMMAGDDGGGVYFSSWVWMRRT